MISIDVPLAQRVQSAIAANPHLVGLAGRNLRYETSSGRVTLRGTVGTFFQKQMAQEALRCIEGIQEIDNALEVSWR